MILDESLLSEQFKARLLTLMKSKPVHSLHDVCALARVDAGAIDNMSMLIRREIKAYLESKGYVYSIGRNGGWRRRLYLVKG